MRYLFITCIFLLSGCDTGPSRAQLEYNAFDRVVAERQSKGQMTAAEADLARTQYRGAQEREADAAAATYLMMMRR